MSPAISQLVLPGTIIASVTNFQPDDGSRNFSFLQGYTGDILLTGTPARVGMATDTYSCVADKVEAEIDGLGKLEVEIIPDRATARTPRAG
jgi:hypothetical protein